MGQLGEKVCPVAVKRVVSASLAPLKRVFASPTRLSTVAKEVDQRFKQVDQRFEQVDQNFEQVDQRLGRLDTAMQTLLRELVQIRLENTEFIKVLHSSAGRSEVHH